MQLLAQSHPADTSIDRFHRTLEKKILRKFYRFVMTRRLSPPMLSDRGEGALGGIGFAAANNTEAS